MEINCTGCAGCEYDPCPREAEMVNDTLCRDTVHRVQYDIHNLKDTVLRVPVDEIVDLERMNFLEWYRTATLKDLAMAVKNNAAKLDELKKKYAKEIELMDIVGRWTR